MSSSILNRGEVWLVDLGYVAKVRPCLVMSIPVEDEDRALVTLVGTSQQLACTRSDRDDWLSAKEKLLYEPTSLDCLSMDVSSLVPLLSWSRRNGIEDE
jgi:hypothetical protein